MTWFLIVSRSNGTKVGFNVRAETYEEAVKRCLLSKEDTVEYHTVKKVEIIGNGVHTIITDGIE